MSGLERVEIVDLDNRVVGHATRAEVRATNALHRCVAVLCRNSAKEIYVQRRTTTKDVFPDMYDVFVGGVVGAGESYEDAAAREVAEELGIRGPPPVRLFDHLYDGPASRSWTAVFEVTWDGPVEHQASEVAWGAYMTLDDIVLKLDDWPFVPDGREIFERYRREAR